MVYDTGNTLDAKVADVIENGSWHWPTARSEAFVQIQAALCGDVTPNIEQADEILWTAASSGQFTIHSAWSKI